MPNTRANPEWDRILEVTGPAHWFDVPHHDRFRSFRSIRDNRRKYREGTQEEERIKLCLKFSTAPHNGTPWFWIGRDEGSDIRIDSTAAVSGCHLRVGFDEWGRVIIQDPSKFGSIVIYKQLPHVNSTRRPFPQQHESFGNKADPPHWIVPVGWTVSMMLGQTEIRILFQVPDHSFHMNEYQQMVQNFQNHQNNLVPFLGGLALESRALTTGDMLPTAQRSAPHGSKGRSAWIVGDKLIGHGASSQVFEVFNSSNWARCAGKRVRNYREFQHEYSLMITLEHRHIVQYIDIQTMMGFGPMIIMEYCHLGSLHQQQRVSGFNEYETLMIMAQSFSAIDYLHSKKITHRDLKPGNILVRSREPLEIAVGDFGWSKQGGVAMGTYAGTDYYAAPEVLELRDAQTHGGFRELYTNMSDMWSLGVIAVELVYGRLPTFDGQRGFDLDYCIWMSEQVPKIIESLRDAQFAGLVEDLLSWYPNDRPTAADCLSRISELMLDDEDDTSERPYGSESGETFDSVSKHRKSHQC